MFGKHSLGMEEKKCYVERYYFRKKIKLWWKNDLTREKEEKIRKTPEKNEILHHITQKKWQK